MVFYAVLYFDIQVLLFTMNLECYVVVRYSTLAMFSAQLVTILKC